MTAIEVNDEAAGLFNAKLIATTIKRLEDLRPKDRRQALQDCVPVISQFAMSLGGSRRHKISAWTSLDFALQNRMKPGGVRAVALALTGRARKVMLAEGRFDQGERKGFDEPVIEATV